MDLEEVERELVTSRTYTHTRVQLIKLQLQYVQHVRKLQRSSSHMRPCGPELTIQL